MPRRGWPACARPTGSSRTSGEADPGRGRAGGDNRFSRARPRCEPLDMHPSTVRPPFDRFLATAEAVAQARPDVDAEMAREVFLEVAVMLDNGLALDGLDEHDAAAVVDGLCVDLVAA